MSRIWLEELLRELMIPIKTPMQLKIDNVYAINFLRDMVNKGRITLVYCNTEMQLAGCVYKCLEV